MHGAEFACNSAEDYEILADKFLTDPTTPSLLECFRPDGQRVRLDKTTDMFGVLTDDNIILTLFKAIPCSSLHYVEADLARRTGRCHESATNLLYFQSECRKTR